MEAKSLKRCHSSNSQMFIVALCVSLSTGCDRKPSSVSVNDASSPTNAAEVSQAANGEKPFDYAKYQREKDAALAFATKQYEENMRHPPTNRIRLPNWVAGPGRPKPVGINFYTMDEHYTDYLCCGYDVNEQHYDPSNEPEWFKASILQIRGTGQGQFPPIKWIAIAIRNVAEHKGASTFEQSFKVGAIFEASEVFDPQINPDIIIAKAQKDRHPFHYDSKTEEQHWVIVEHDALEQTNTTHLER